MNLRWRLTLFYSVGATLILLVGSLALFFGLRLSLYQLLDQSLGQAAQTLERRFDGDRRFSPMNGQGPRFRPNPPRPRLPGDTSLSVFSASGIADQEFDPSPVNAPLEPGVRTVNGYRVLTRMMPSGDIVQAARSETDALRALLRVQQLLWIGLPLLFVLSLGAGYALADRALRPVDAVTRLAARIAASGAPGERVPETPNDDEMGRLTRTVNAMLEKLEALIAQERAFALAAAHELRTPLAVLQGRVELSLERERTPEHYRESLATVAATTKKLNRLVEGLLTLARSHTPPQQVRLDLADVAIEMTETHRSEAKARGQRIELEVSTAPTLGDPDAVRLIASNLIRNAIRYGVDDGRVWVRTTIRGGLAVLEVRDNGPGVPDHDLERLRHPFQRGKGLQAVQGSGLGLALVNAVAEQHGGRLELGRAPEGGFCARVLLPSASARTSAKPEAAPSMSDT